MKKILFSSFILLAFLTSCKREIIPADQVELGKEYFPLEVGSSIEYEVDSMIYNNFTHDTDYKHLQFHDEITSTFEDNSGHQSFIMERSLRYDTSSSWQEYLTYYITPSNFDIQVVENNLRFIKMVFPVKLNTTWKGNVFIPAASSGLDELKWYGDWDYKYKNINEDFNNGVAVFPNSVQISYSHLTNDSLGIAAYSDFTNYKEAYSKNTGLVYRELTHWEFQKTDGFRKGFSLVMRALPKK